MLSLAKNPPMIWPAKARMAEVDCSWTVAYCKPGQEKALAWDLCRRDVTYFLPMVIRETSSGGRRRRNFYPLFPSYLFMAGGDADRLIALRTDRLVKFIEISDTEQATFRREISFLEAAIRDQPESIEMHPRLVPGAWVRIIAGPMKGVEGVVVQANNKRKLLLSVSVLGVGATVEIHGDLVESN